MDLEPVAITDWDQLLVQKPMPVPMLRFVFPFPFIPDNLGLSGAVFADAGLMFDPIQASGVLKDNTMRASVGAGVLWDSPMGPLRVDFAYALNDKSTDRTQVFSFGASCEVLDKALLYP